MTDRIDDIKQERLNAMRSREVVMLVKHDYGWRVEHWFPDGVAPPSDYDTPHEAAARALQLLKIKVPVTPQDWPEIAQIGGEGRAKPPRHRPNQ